MNRYFDKTDIKFFKILTATAVVMSFLMWIVLS